MTPRFAAERESASRAIRPWTRYGYHLRTLRERLRALVGMLEVAPGERVLDYGSAESPYRSYFPAEADFVAADLPGNPDAAIELTEDGAVPGEDGSFDVVLSTQVLEHVTDPRLHLSEAFRVLRPGGRLLLSTHGVFVWHPDPVDYWRWTGEGLQREVENAGFRVVHREGIVGLLPTAIQLAGDALYWHVPGRLRRPLVALVELLMGAADRLHSEGGRRYNAQVFALIAEKLPP